MFAELLSPLILPGAPTAAMHAANKGWIDATFAPLASPALTGTPTAPTAAAGTNTTQIATTAFVKTAVDAAVAGLDWHEHVRLATSADLNGAYTYANGVITGPANTALANIDGMAPAVGDRILLKNAANAAHNGIYVVDALGSGTSQYQLTRATDMDEPAEFTRMQMVPVRLGTDNDGKWFYISATGADPVVVGTSTITFSEWAGTTYSADGQGLELVGTQFSLELDGTTLSKSASGLKVSAGGISATELANGAVTAAKKQTYTTKFGDGTATSFTITHNLGVENCIVTVKRRSDNRLVGCDVTLTDANTVTLSGFTSAPAANALEVFIDPVSARAA